MSEWAMVSREWGVGSCSWRACMTAVRVILAFDLLFPNIAYLCIFSFLQDWPRPSGRG